MEVLVYVSSTTAKQEAIKTLGHRAPGFLNTPTLHFHPEAKHKTAPCYLARDVLHAVRIIRLLTCSAKLFEVNLWPEKKDSPRAKGLWTLWARRCQFRGLAYLVGALDTPHVGTLPPDVTVLAVVITVFLF